MQNIVSISLSDFPSSFVNKDIFFSPKRRRNLSKIQWISTIIILFELSVMGYALGMVCLAFLHKFLIQLFLVVLKKKMTVWPLKGSGTLLKQHSVLLLWQQHISALNGCLNCTIHGQSLLRIPCTGPSSIYSWSIGYILEHGF